MPKELIRARRQMDMVRDTTTMIVNEEEEDRISKLPHDVIRCILSFLDLKDSVKFCMLSRNWKGLWTSNPYLRLNSSMFDNATQFTKFVEHVLSHRDNRLDVSTLDLTVKGTLSELIIEKIVNYAYEHNVKKLAMICVAKKFSTFPKYLLSSRTLKHLTLNDKSEFPNMNRILESTWDFPALETLNLSNMGLYGPGSKRAINPFSKCLNLKDLTLHHVSIPFLDLFNVSAPQLLNLTITDPRAFPKVLNVVCPQLKNFTASVLAFQILYISEHLLPLTTEGLGSLEKVNLSLRNPGNKRKINLPILLNLFQRLRSATFLILNSELIETLYEHLDQLSHEPCPFNNLKCLKIENVPLSKKDRIKEMAIKVNKYLLENSPSATIIMDLPPKRSREQKENDTLSKKVAKLEAELQIQIEIATKEKKISEAKIQMQDEVIAEHKGMLEATKLQHEKFMSEIIKCKMAELKLLVESGNPDYKIIRSMGCDIKSVMDLMTGSLRINAETQYISKYKEVKGLLLTCIDSSQWEMVETELGNIKHSGRTSSNNNHTVTGVRANMTSSPSVISNMVFQP